VNDRSNSGKRSRKRRKQVHLLEKRSRRQERKQARRKAGGADKGATPRAGTGRPTAAYEPSAWPLLIRAETHGHAIPPRRAGGG
jgi:hypothetical protein